MTRRPIVLTAAYVGIALCVHTAVRAQTPQPQPAAPATTRQVAGPPEIKTEQLNGEVVMVHADTLLVKITPGDTLRTFTVPADRRFLIDGQSKTLAELKPGTTLSATVTTTTQPMTVRTETVTNGTVRYVAGNYVMLDLPDGQTKGYSVPASFNFVVDGHPATVNQLKTGMKVNATRVVSEPQTEFKRDVVVTGKAPADK